MAVNKSGLWSWRNDREWNRKLDPTSIDIEADAAATENIPSLTSSGTSQCVGNGRSRAVISKRRFFSYCIRGHSGVHTDEKPPLPRDNTLHPPRVDSLLDSTQALTAPRESPPPSSQEQKKVADQRRRELRSQMTRDQTYEGYLAMVSRHDALRMAKGIDRRAAQIARSENSLAEHGHDREYIERQVAKEKLEAIRYLRPGPCQVCQKDGNGTVKVVRTCATFDQKHWYHEKCLRGMFLEAAKDEGRMPPTCCGQPIAEVLGFQFLSDEQIQSFKDKKEEKETAKRTYCPVSSCKQFIPNRIIEKCIDERVEALKDVTRRPRGYISGAFRCPRCAVSICLICKNSAHSKTDCPEG